MNGSKTTQNGFHTAQNGFKTSQQSTSAPVEVETGALSGLQLPNNTRAFLGVPYAAPPVGDLRWRPPQRPQPWDGVRSAEKFGPSAIQRPPPATSLYYGKETEFSEDCLYLNIWTGPEGADNRPVLVWSHFGAFIFGSGSNPTFNGAKLAAEGVTVVTINYRLGRFGFLAHKELSAESEHQTSGNYGLMDQIAALEWVQRNIKAFGGDPTNVTLGGASAGGVTAHILRASPLANGLFSKVICESGAGLAPVLDGPGHFAAFTTLRAAEESGAELLEQIGVSSIAELRKLPPQKITSVFLPSAKGVWKAALWPATSSPSIFDTACPIVDGHVLPGSLEAAHLSGQVVDVPMLAGNVGNECSGLPHLRTLAEYHDYAKEYFGDFADEALRLYPAKTEAEVRTWSSRMIGDQIFVWPTWSSARFQVRNLQSPVWYYKFLRVPPIPRDSDVAEKEWADAFHGAGPLYGFGNLETWEWDWTDADRALSKAIFSSWVRFLHTGKPTDDEGWPALTSSSDAVKVWDVEPHLEKSGSRLNEVTAFWDKFLLTRHRSPLSRVPGPWYTRYTRLVLKFHIVTGRRVFYVHDLHQKYGPTVRVAPHEVSIADISDFARIHGIASGFNKSAWYDSASTGITGYLEPGLFSLRDPKAHAQRRRLFSRVFSKSFLRRQWEAAVRETVECAVAGIKQDAERGSADILKWWTLMTNDVISHLAFGDSFDMVKQGEKNSYVIALQSALFVGGLREEVPWVEKIGRWVPTQAVRNVFCAEQIVFEHGSIAVENLRRQGGSQNVFSQALANVEDEKSNLSDLIIRLEASNFMIAGSDTTAVTLTYLVWAVLQRPNLQRRLEDEVAALEPDFTDEQLEGLPLLDSVIQETLRLYGAAPGSLPRVVPDGGATFSGHFLPAGTIVSTQAYTTHRNPDVFPNPFKFDEARFATGKTQAQNAALSPFGAGSRVCIGLHLAQMEIRLAAVMFFRSCRGIRLSKDMTDSDMEFENHFLIAPRGHRCNVTLQVS